jgi:hypothetical protein
VTDLAPQFEIEDLAGSVTILNGTVGTTNTLIPGSPGNAIAEFLFINKKTNNPTATIQVSVDGGTNWVTVGTGGSYSGSLRGNITQLTIKGSAAGLAYECQLNREPI